ncbi:MAG: hypothetical protein JXR63_06665 [Spirochaetales bacterium]|nr:hypothetical protein [Spirochaetales bacterium]
MRKKLTFFIILISLLSCETIDQFFAKIDEKDIETLAATERLFVEQIFSENNHENEILSNLSRLTSIPNLNKKFQARVNSVEILFFNMFKNKEFKEYRQKINDTEFLNKKEPLLLAINILNQKTNDQIFELALEHKKDILLVAITTKIAFSRNKIDTTLILTDLVIANSKDDEIITSAINFRAKVKKLEKIAEFKDTDIISPTQPSFSIEQMSLFLVNEAKKREMPIDFTPQLLNLSKFYNKNLKDVLQQTATKRDVAIALLEIIIYFENDFSYRFAQTEYFTKNNMVSPILDVPVEDPCFDAVNILYERGFVQLDRMFFKPDSSENAADFLEKVKDIFNFY